MLRKAPFTTSVIVLFSCLYLVLLAQHLYVQNAVDVAYTFKNPFGSAGTAISWANTYPESFLKWCAVVGVGVAISITAYAYSFFTLRRNKPIEDMHGSSRWANYKEIKKTGLLENEGVIIGGIDNGKGTQYLRHDGGEHLMVVAPTRSGKGVSIILPTLLSLRDSSAIITDIKGELWALTSGWRHRYAKQNCYRFDASNPDSAKFNPLDTIRVGMPEEIGDCTNMATTIVDGGSGMEGSDGHWKKSAQALIAGMIVYTLNKAKLGGETASLTQISLLIMSPDSDLNTVLEEGIKDTDQMEDTIAEFIKSSFRQHLEREGTEAASVVSTTGNYLSLYRDPIVAKNTSTSDFTVESLVNGDFASTLYMVINPNDKSRLLPVTRLILTVIIRNLTAKLDFVDNRAVSSNDKKMLLLLDELPALGKLDVITDTLPYMSTYGLKAMLICQDYSQLREKYGRDESITASCHVRVAFAPNKLDTAQALSGLTGTTTIVKKEKSTTGSAKIGMWSEKHDRYSETSRPLMTPEEIMRLKGLEKTGDVVTAAGEVLVFVAGQHPIKGKQPLYFQDKYLSARADEGAADQPVSLASAS